MSRPAGARSGPRPVLDPPRADRGRRERPARPSRTSSTSRSEARDEREPSPRTRHRGHRLRRLTAGPGPARARARVVAAAHRERAGDYPWAEQVEALQFDVADEASSPRPSGRRRRLLPRALHGPPRTSWARTGRPPSTTPRAASAPGSRQVVYLSGLVPDGGEALRPPPVPARGRADLPRGAGARHRPARRHGDRIRLDLVRAAAPTLRAGAAVTPVPAWMPPGPADRGRGRRPLLRCARRAKPRTGTTTSAAPR